jgi:hypothetical protein
MRLDNTQRNKVKELASDPAKLAAFTATANASNDQAALAIAATAAQAKAAQDYQTAWKADPKNKNANQAAIVAAQRGLLVAQRDALKSFATQNTAFKPSIDDVELIAASDEDIFKPGIARVGRGAKAAGINLVDGSQADSTAPSLANSVLPAPSMASSSGGGSSNLSQYDLKDSDYGGLGPDPRAPKPKQTPLESLLASIYPDLAAGAPADPFADPRVPTSNSTFQNVLSGLGQRGSANGFVPGGPSLSGPAPVGPSAGANLAATIPGAPPFLAGAINGVQQFNPYAQRPAAPVGGGGGGFDPLIGLSAISAEQRIQAAELAKNKAAAQAKWFKSQADQEQMLAEQANMSRLKGFSGSGFTPAMPTY